MYRSKPCLLLKVEKPLNMILDDGGDLTNMVLDHHPELVAEIKRSFGRNYYRCSQTI